MKMMKTAMVLTICLGWAAAAWSGEKKPAKAHPDSSKWDDLFADDLSNANFPEGIWHVRQGVLMATEDQCIWTKKQYENFVLDLEFKNAQGTNSGVFVYCSDPGNFIPNSVEVQTSTDGYRFTTRGRDRHRSARYAHNGWPADWPLHPRHDAPSSGPFPDFGLKANYIFVPFEKPVEARYVKFLIEAQPGWGFQLTEVNVWDSLKAQPWTPRLAHDSRQHDSSRLDGRRQFGSSLRS